MTALFVVSYRPRAGVRRVTTNPMPVLQAERLAESLNEQACPAEILPAPLAAVQLAAAVAAGGGA